MKQATVKLPSGTYLIQEVNREIEIVYPSNWQLLFADPLKPTEEEAGEIVETYNDGCLFCRDYSLKTPVFGIRATASLDSLAASLGIEKPFVILKLKKQ